MSGTPGLNQRSGMISLDLPAGTVRPVPGGVDDHHVTVVYLGPDVDDAAFAKACARARDAAAKADGPLKGLLAGVDSFPPSDSSEGKRPAFAPVRLPGAKRLRSGLQDLSASEHKNWVPHVTLAYVGKDDPLPPPVPPTPVKFTHLSVHRGKDVRRFPLGGKVSGMANAASAIGLSASTAAYSETPAPLGRPGGPGLWRTRNLKLPDYIEQIATGIMKGGEADKSRAIALAVAAVKRWASGGGKVSPEVRAAAAKALAEWTALKASHSHANEGGAVVSLTWNGRSIDLASIDLGYLPPHLPAGSPQGGQFGTTAKGTNSGGTAGKTPAQQHALHMAHIEHLQHLVATGKATPAQRAELAGLLKALKGTTVKPKAVKAKAAVKPKAPAKPKAAVKKTAAPKAAVKPKTVPKPKTPAAKPKTAKPVVDKKKGTVTTTVNGKKVTVTLAQWHAAHVAHLEHVAHLKAVQQRKAAGLGNDTGRFLDLAFTEALAGRVPPGQREGGQFTEAVPQLTRHDTPAQAARAINAMEAAQRAMVRASVMAPPGFTWGPNDRLTAAEHGAGGSGQAPW